MPAKKKATTSNLILPEDIKTKIFIIRGKRVMLDSDLAIIYGVSTKRLNEQVKRNTNRFPDDFMFVLTKEEFEHLKSQIATSKTGRGGRRSSPCVFTEHGAVMLASILNSDIAIAASIHVVRAFIRMKELLSSHSELKRKIDRIEKKMDEKFGQNAQQIKFIFEAITKLLTPPKVKAKKVKKIGYKTK